MSDQQINSIVSNDTEFDIGSGSLVETDAFQLIKDYYYDYASYLITARSIPNICDGLKPSYKRLMMIAQDICPSKFTKSSKLLGHTLEYHPHSLDGLYSSLVSMTSPRVLVPLFDAQGSWGTAADPGAAAYRYTEMHLNEVGKFGFLQFIKYADYDIGEVGLKEPVALPALVPFSLLTGLYGLAVGLATNVMPLNALEVIDYYIDTIKGKSKKKVPTPDVGNCIIDMDDTEIDKAVLNHSGRLILKSIVIQESNNQLVIEGSVGRSIENIVSSLGKDYINNGRVDFRDESKFNERYVFEIVDPSVDITELTNRLTRLTTCSKSFSRVVYDGDKAIYSSFDYQVQKSLEYLNKCIDKKFSSELAELEHKKLTLEAIMYIRSTPAIIDNLGKLSEDDLVKLVMKGGFTEEIAKSASSKPIRYLTRSYDNELTQVKEAIKALEDTDRTEYLVELYTKFKSIVKPIYNNRFHSIRRSSVLTTPKINFNKNALVISNRGELYDAKVSIITNKFNIYHVQAFSKLKRTIDLSPIIDEDEVVMGMVTDKYQGFAMITKKGIIVRNTSIRHKSPVSHYDESDKIVKIIPLSESELSGETLVEVDNEKYKMSKFYKKRIAGLIPWWKSAHE